GVPDTLPPFVVTPSINILLGTTLTPDGRATVSVNWFALDRSGIRTIELLGRTDQGFAYHIAFPAAFQTSWEVSAPHGHTHEDAIRATDSNGNTSESGWSVPFAVDVLDDDFVNIAYAGD